MKKALVVLLILAVAGGLFAADPTLSWSAWGRGTVVPFAANTDTGKSAAVVGPSWESVNQPRVGFTIEGKSDNIGFKAEVYAGFDLATYTWDAGTSTITSSGGLAWIYKVGDNAYVWAKPWDILTVTAGKYYIDDLRGKIGGANSGITLYNAGGGNDDIFQRSGSGNIGFALTLKPVDGLTAIYSVPNLTAGAKWDGTKFVDDGAVDALRYSQFGIGYAISGIGLVRAQYVGTAGKDLEYANVAFQLTAVDQLNIDVGGKFWFSDKGSKPIVRLGVNYGSASKAGGLWARLGVKSQLYDNPFVGIGAEVEYGITDTVGVAGDVSFGLSDSGTKDANYLGFTVQARKTLAKGDIRAGVTGKVGVGDKAAKGAIIAVPVCFTYSF